MASVACDEDYATDGSTGGPDDNPAATETGFPVVQTLAGYLPIDTTLCNLRATYEDEAQIVVCEGSYRYRRNWSFVNWCDPAETLDYDQFISVADEVGPVILNLVDTITISTSPFSCAANLMIPCPVVTDGNGCSTASPTTYTLLAFGEFFFGTGDLCSGIDIQVPIGKHILLLCAEDDCGNETCVETCLIVSDAIPPVAVCIPELEVAIGGGDILNGIEGIWRIFPENINDGSYDNCGEVTFELRRNFWRNNSCDLSANRWSPWGEWVDFYCCDVGEGIITVELRVTDGGGQQTVCTTNVTVVDVMAPVCFAPNDEEFTCGNPPDGFPTDIETAYSEEFGATSALMNTLFGGSNGGASGTDNCATDTVVEMQPLFQFNECGWGTITRRFEMWQLRPEGDVNGNNAIDIDEVFRSTNSCNQTITVEEAHGFLIDFPADAEVDCGTPDFPGVQVIASGCDVLAINVSDPVPFAATGEECYQLAVTYNVINWCIWDGESAGLDIPRRTEEDGTLLANGYTVEAAERPVLHITTTGNGPDDENCDGILSTSENGADDANDLRYSFTIDRSHPDVDGDSSLPNENYDNVAETAEPCFPASGSGPQNYGRYRYVQMLRVNGGGNPELVPAEFGGPTVNVPNLDPGQFADDDGDCLSQVSIPFTFNNDCLLVEGLDLPAGGTVTAQLDEFAVDMDADSTISLSEFVSDEDVSGAIATGEDGNYVFTGNLPIISSAMGDSIRHALRLTFTDNCGNTETGVITFDVVDRYIAPPICIDELTVDLMAQADGECAAIVAVETLVAQSLYDCTGQGPEVDAEGNLLLTSYAIYLSEEVETNPNFVPDSTHTTITLTEENDETTMVYLYSFDEEGNYDYCETHILLQYSSECDRLVQGIIVTKEDEPIEDVIVELTGSEGGFASTGPVGLYQFGLYPADIGNYTITPTKIPSTVMA